VKQREDCAKKFDSGAESNVVVNLVVKITLSNSLNFQFPCQNLNLIKQTFLAEVPQLQSMQETASKFLFDNNSQSMMKFEEPMSFSPFNTRFSQNNFDLFINKYNASNHEDTYFFNNNNRSMSLKPAFSNLSMEKFPKSKFEENAHAILSIKDTPSTTSNKGTPNETKSKTIILQTSDTSNQKKKKMKKVRDMSEFVDINVENRNPMRNISKRTKRLLEF